MTSPSPWKFRIDVGGTFTDCLARDPQGRERVVKVLSSGVVKGMAGKRTIPGRLVDETLAGFPARFFDGWNVRPAGDPRQQSRVLSFDSNTGTLLTADAMEDLSAGARFELFCDQAAPLVAIRLALGIGLKDPIGPVEVRLGTTRATNALLERKGAATALLINRGFGDLLLVGNQDRPRLFDLEIRKPTPLFSRVLELDCRMDSQGKIVRELDEEALWTGLHTLMREGVQSLAVCLLHSWKNPAHEERVEEIAREIGFKWVSRSSMVSATPRIIPRADTTVADAYLTPVVHDYIASIQAHMPEARLHLVTSAGSLVSPGRASGKDLVLSGPAGGVTAVALVAKRAGYTKAIGFDMGGTSTDVCRWDGTFDYEYETEKAGVRLVTPMLAIETVAAGGGSICGFDGYRLIVGPESAGANPGPACYGAGGPLTVTDMNVLLGRVRPERFPFPLDMDALHAKVATRIAEISGATGTVYTPHELAEGYLRIANMHMAAAIRRISVAKGYDPREYCLVAFGGAGAQHAAAIAAELGMKRALIHPMAGILSAWGMEGASIRRHAVRGVLLEYTSGNVGAMEDVYRSMIEELTTELEAEGVSGGQLDAPVRQADMRYRGQGTAITVTLSPGVDAVEEFSRLHKQLYGYTFSGRAVEAVSLRVELGERAGEPNLPPETKEIRRIVEPGCSNVVFNGAIHSTGNLDRDDLHQGFAMSGPLLITENTSITIIPPGWNVEVTDKLDLILSGEEGAKDAGASINLSEPDPILLEVLNSQLAGIATEMGAALRRTALSVNVKERLDYSCAIFTAEGDLVVNAPHMPVHLGSMGACVKRVIKDLAPFDPTDVIITNDPMRGGSHIPDVTVVNPVCDASGALMFFVASRAHHAEIGGKRPGSMPPDSTNLAEEGVLIRGFRLIDKSGEHFAELDRLLRSGRYPSRAPGDNIADIQAQIAANNRGADELRRMIARYGRETVAAYMRFIQDAAAGKARDCLGRLGDGTRSFEDFLDDGSRVSVRLDIHGDKARIDFTGTSPVLRGNLNANPGIVTAAILYTLRCLIREDIPLNAGVLQPLEIVLPQCFLNPPEHEDPEQCAAVVGGNVETSQRVVDTLMGAFQAVAASQGTMNNLTFGNKSFGYYETICGGSGAGPTWNGTDAVHTHMTNTRLTDPEVFEIQYPVRLLRFEIRRGSGGGGRYRGGDGVRREIQFLQDIELSMLTQRRTRAPWGMEGGLSGEPGRNLLRLAGEAVYTEMPGAFTVPAPAGSLLMIETPGGGGWGNP